MSGVRDEVDRRIISFTPSTNEIVGSESNDDDDDGLAGVVAAV
jgi:hypothetical protein